MNRAVSLATVITGIVLATGLCGCGGGGGGGGSTAASSTGSVSGFIVYSSAALPVAGATVTIDGQTATSGTNGAFTVNNVAYGPETITVTNAGSTIGTATTTVSSSNDSVGDITVSSAGSPPPPPAG